MLAQELGLKKLRMDCRACDECRRVETRLFNSMLVVRSGSSPRDSCLYFSFSKTKTEPFPDKPAEGILQLSLEKGKKNDPLLNLLHNVYIKSKCVSMADLCLRPSREVYLLNIEIHPIQADGDLYRLCVAGINEILRVLDVKTYFQPRVFQCACVGGTVMDDPGEEEVAASSWSTVVVMKSTREILLVDKVGGECSIEDILKSVDRAMSV